MSYYLVSVSFMVCIDDSSNIEELKKNGLTLSVSKNDGSNNFLIKADAYRLGNHSGNLFFFNSSVDKNDKNTKNTEEVCVIASGDWYGVQKIL